MATAQSHADSWKRMVLRSMPAPAWLSIDAPHSDIVLSSRTRIMRNLGGHRFPHHAEPDELRQVAREVLAAAKSSGLDIEIIQNISNAERDYLVGCRLMSPDFATTAPGRALLLDKGRRMSVMINEEDHLRLQALTAGWSLHNSEEVANATLHELGKNLRFARSPRFGFLSASPYNAGEGRRLSAMFHLIGLAQAKRLPNVMKALSARGIAVRGLFGESSRAVGAFFQVSVSSGTRPEFVGACDYLIDQERAARSEVTPAAVAERTRQAADFAIASTTISLTDALRVLAWVRWASSAGSLGSGRHPREVDSWLTTLEVRGTADEAKAARHRASFLRTHLERFCFTK
jgi:protein arginine kinase